MATGGHVQGTSLWPWIWQMYGGWVVVVEAQYECGWPATMGLDIWELYVFNHIFCLTLHPYVVVVPGRISTPLPLGRWVLLSWEDQLPKVRKDCRWLQPPWQEGGGNHMQLSLGWPGPEERPLNGRVF